MVRPFACPHDQSELGKELLADQANNNGERMYDLYDGSDGWPGDELAANWKPQMIESRAR